LARRKAGLQRRGTKVAKRKLRKLSSKQARFQRQENHRISKAVVLEAQRSGRAIGLEDIKIVRNRVKASRSHRAKLGNWSFGQFRQFVEYKTRRAGIPVLFVNPTNTSRTCPECGLISKANRPNQATFSCVRCGYQGHADEIAAQNIRSRAEAELVTRPYVLGPPLG
jgi:IS605 OrfB family transposase